MIEYFLPAIIALGIITSYEDIKLGKIRNRWIIAALVFSVAMNIILFLKTGELYWAAILAINFLISVLLSFALWSFGFWSAGDAKLFIAYSALIPAAAYSRSDFDFFPSFYLFLNTIVPYFIFLLAKSIFSSPRKRIKKAFFSAAKSFPLLFLSFLAIGWLADLVNSHFFRTRNLVEIFVIYALVYFVTDLVLTGLVKKFKLKKIKTWHIYAMIFIARIVISPEIFTDYSALATMLLSSLAYALIIRTTRNICTSGLARRVKIKDLRTGDIPAEGIFRLKKNYAKRAVSEKDFIFNKSLLSMEAEGLTNEDLARIRALAKRKKLGFRTISVYETVPFAPIIFFGALLTIISNGIFINLVIYFI